MELELNQDILSDNSARAEANRALFNERKVLAINLLASPGAGKTTFIERTIELMPDTKFAVIEGDLASDVDTRRLIEKGARAHQINTNGLCHLNAKMIDEAVRVLEPEPESVLLIENVGNLVCTAEIDLGEAMKVVLLSVPEGDDKPLKYPHMFHEADLLVVTKKDLAPYTDFDLERLKKSLQHLKPELDIIFLSATTGECFADWTSRLQQEFARFSR